MAEELKPWLIFSNRDGQGILATWRLEKGETALAIFSTIEKAEQYRQTHLAAEWEIIQPEPNQLVSILEVSLADKILYAVLDPSESDGRTLFPLEQIVQSAKSGNDEITL